MSIDAANVMRGLGLEARVIRPPDDEEVQRAFEKLGEIEQQFQIEVSGTAGSGWSWVQKALTFDVEFVNGINQRYSNLTEPQMTCGAVLRSGSNVALTGTVTSWAVDDRDLITGCVIEIGASGSGEFEGVLHVNFQGYGAPADEPGLDVE